MKIIAVDDKSTPLKALEHAIRAAAPTAEVNSFLNGADALAFVEKSPCDAAFIDIQMPEINGIELAKRLKLMKPDINIIFATGYDDYMYTAFSIHASGYLMKPITPEAVRNELDNLRTQAAVPSRKRMRIQCFGNFEVFADEKPLKFKYQKTKEIFAYLVDRNAVCSNAEIIAALWQNDISGSHFRNLRKDLVDTLKQADCGEVVVLRWGGLGIDIEKTDCDFLEWKKGVPAALNAYRGEYMSQYSWAEFSKGAFGE